jgi:cyclic pyranopterin phosphate synthase
MQDRFHRQIEYLRISVTDRCNLRCTYCMPEEGVQLKSHEEMLTLEEIGQLVEAVAPLGISKIRLTGGEPLVRKGLPALVKRLTAIPGISDVSLTTNGVLLTRYARELKAAGLSRVNISLDTLNAKTYRQITRWGDISQVHQGIEAALAERLEPVKLNVVVIKGANDHEVLDFVQLTLGLPLHVRFIELMPIGESAGHALSTYLPAKEIKKLVEAKYRLSPVLNVKGSGPAKYFQIPGAKGTVGFIGALSEHFCHACNRLRLTADGRLRPCLQKSLEFDLREPLRSGATAEEIRQIFRQVISCKPKEHSMQLEGWGKQERIMSQIGG